jgi:ribosomal protein S18 acetylase RimI-like enzyme
MSQCTAHNNSLACFMWERIEFRDIKIDKNYEITSRHKIAIEQQK